MRNVSTVVLILVLAAVAFADAEVTLKSPDGSVSAVISTYAAGGLR